MQVELTGEYEHSPIVTADNALALLKKETGIGSRDTQAELERRAGGYTIRNLKILRVS